VILTKSQIEGGYWIVSITLDGGFSIKRGYFTEPDIADPAIIQECEAHALYLREMRIQDGRYKASVQEAEDKERSYGTGTIHDA
jgi:hypothetical protein